MGEVERIQVEARWNRVWRPWELQGGRWLVVVAGDGSGARDGRSRGADGGRGRSVAAPWGGDNVEEGRLQGQRWWKMRATTMSGLRRRQGRSRAREEVGARRSRTEATGPAGAKAGGHGDAGSGEAMGSGTRERGGSRGEMGIEGERCERRGGRWDR